VRLRVVSSSVSHQDHAKRSYIDTLGFELRREDPTGPRVHRGSVQGRDGLCDACHLVFEPASRMRKGPRT
jgi:hypothetical protein